MEDCPCFAGHGVDADSESCHSHVPFQVQVQSLGGFEPSHQSPAVKTASLYTKEDSFPVPSFNVKEGESHIFEACCHNHAEIKADVCAHGSRTLSTHGCGDCVSRHGLVEQCCLQHQQNSVPHRSTTSLHEESVPRVVRSTVARSSLRVSLNIFQEKVLRQLRGQPSGALPCVRKVV